MAHGQFYHYELYGRKSSGKSKKKGNATLYSIIGEAFREPKFSLHCDQHDTENSPPEIAYTDMIFDDTLTEKEKLDIQKAQLINLAEEYAKSKKLRGIDGCILAGVVSYPPETTKEQMIKIREERVIPFLKKKWGKNLRCIISHGDEYFWDDLEKKKWPHFQDHFFIIPDADGTERLTRLHEGEAAKRDATTGKSKPPNKQKQRQIFEQNLDKAILVKYIELIELLLKNFDLTEWQIISLCIKIPKTKNENMKKMIKENIKKCHSDIAYRVTMSRLQNETFKEIGEKAGWERKTVNGVRYDRETIKRWRVNNQIEEAHRKKAQNEVEECNNSVTQAKTEAEDYSKKTKESADKYAKEKKQKAWEEADDITRAAKKEAHSIIEKAGKFIDTLLEKVNKLLGGHVIVNWAKNFIDSLSKPVNKKKEDIKKNTPNIPKT